MRIVSWMAFLLAVFAMIAVGVAGAQGKGDPAKGKASYDQLCTSCHGPAGKGDGAAAAALNPKPKDLSSKAILNGLKDDFLFRVIKDGGASVQQSPLMPPWGATMKDDEIRNVIAYIRTLAK